MAQTQTCWLLSISYETRNQIYEYLVHTHGILDVSRTTGGQISTDSDLGLGLCLTCRQVRDETTDKLLSSNELVIVSTILEVNEIFIGLKKRACGPIQRISICILCYVPNSLESNRTYQDKTCKALRRTQEILLAIKTLRFAKVQVLGDAWELRTWHELFHLYKALANLSSTKVHVRFPVDHFWPTTLDQNAEKVVLRLMLRR